MIKPLGLKKGDTVAIVSLSSGLAGEPLFHCRFETGCQRLEQEFGLKAKVMPNALKGIDTLYRHPESRARDLMDAFEDSRIKAIICAIGGDDTIRLLPYIDYKTIQNNPKIFMGYSDTTANHFMLYKAGLASYYGPCIMVEFAENAAMHPYTKDAIRHTLFTPSTQTRIHPSPYWTSEYLEWTEPGNKDIARKLTKDDKGFELIQGSGIARGRLLGGCTSVLQMIIGTSIWPDAPDWQDKILALETAEDYPPPDFLLYLLRNLNAQGILQAINGIIVGKPLDEKYYEEYKTVLRQVVGVEANRPEMPILYNINFGHTAPACILPFGIEAEIHSEHKSLKLTEAPVL